MLDEKGSGPPGADDIAENGENKRKPSGIGKIKEGIVSYLKGFRSSKDALNAMKDLDKDSSPAAKDKVVKTSNKAGAALTGARMAFSVMAAGSPGVAETSALARAVTPIVEQAASVASVAQKGMVKGLEITVSKAGDAGKEAVRVVNLGDDFVNVGSKIVEGGLRAEADVKKVADNSLGMVTQSAAESVSPDPDSLLPKPEPVYRNPGRNWSRNNRVFSKTPDLRTTAFKGKVMNQGSSGWNK